MSRFSCCSGSGSAAGKIIGVMVSGGDCAGLNMTVSAIVNHAIGTYGWRVVGFQKGFSGICERPLKMIELRPEDCLPQLGSQGGIFLGSSKDMPFSSGPGSLSDSQRDQQNSFFKLKQSFREGYQEANLDALIVIGGDGSFSKLIQLCEDNEGDFGIMSPVNFVAIPKTIDNDIVETDMAIGHETALEKVVSALDDLQTTAASHDRIIVLEVMGREAGHIALKGGLAGGADAILLPEIPYDFDRLVQHLQTVFQKKKPYALIVVSESVKSPDGCSYQRRLGATGSTRYGGIGCELASRLKECFSAEVRAVSLGHIQRGGSPCAFDRCLGSQFGVKAVDLIAQGTFGVMTALCQNEIKAVPFSRVVNRIKTIALADSLLSVAQSIGIYVGETGEIKEIKGKEES